MASGLPTRSLSSLLVCFVAFLMIALCAGCGGASASTGGGQPPTPTPTPAPPAPTPTPVPFAGVSVKVADATVLPGGIYQYQLLLTEPKPIGNSTTRPSVPGPTGPVRGVAINDASGQAVGIALINGTNITVSAKAPNLPPTFGTDISYPLFTMTMPVNSTATPGSSFPVNLDANSSLFQDANGQNYLQEIVGGTVTIGGTLSINDVIPGGGLLPDRSTLRILGQGFTSNTRITIEGTTVFFTPADTTFVSANEIDVKLCNGTVDPAATTCPNTGASFQLDGERVRAIDKNTNETIQYFTYARTDDESGASATTLVTQVHPMFSRQTYSAGSITWLSDSTHFTGMSVQNTSALDATFKVELLDAGNNVVGSNPSVTVRAGKKITRDIRDWVTSIVGSAATVRVTVTSGPAKLQMLGFVGDTTAGTVVPVVVSGQ